MKRDGSGAHIYMYIDKYIQTLAQYNTANVKISCLATLDNYLSTIPQMTVKCEGETMNPTSPWFNNRHTKHYQ